MPADPKLVRDLFLAVAELPDADRTAYLYIHAGGDAELQAAVERLLAAHEQPASLLNQPAPGMPTVDFPGISERPGTMIGPYKLMEKIGEGGFGLVFVAEQTEPVKRKAALKVIKPGMDSKQVIARFEAERQALAMMDHPNIARVLDAGTTDTGRPYFVMELVRGIPITDYCDQNHLTPVERLELFVSVCHAIQHAHQKGIIHRDIKPSNVLVTSHDGKPVAKVIDFGVAKAIHQHLTERTIYTQFAQMIGTPLYMSPEQAEMSGLDIDTRSDIYSLGVLLYELLTGSTPLERKRLAQAAYDEIRRAIREDDPPRPSDRLSTSETLPSLAANRKTEPARLSRMLKGELDWIVMKALEKDRTRRYETANGFARDIQRYLSDEVVEARPASVGYRLRKFVARNRGKVIAAGLVLLTLVAGIVGTWWGLIRARQERDVAELERQQAIEARHDALDAQTKMAETMIDLNRAKMEAIKKGKQAEDRLKQIEKANDILGSIFKNLDPHEVAKKERPLQAILVENLDKAVAQLEGEAIGDPLTVAAMQVRFGESLINLGEPTKAIVLLEKARDTYVKQHGPEGQSLTCLGALAGAYRDAGKIKESIPLFEQLLKLQKARLGDSSPFVHRTMNNLALAFQSSGDLPRALPLLEDSLRLLKRSLGLDHVDTLACMNNLALAYQESGKLEQAIPLFEESLRRTTAKLGDNHPHTLTSMDSLAAGYLAAGKYELSHPLFEAVLKIRSTMLGPDHPHTIRSLNNLAASYCKSRQFDRALPLLEETLQRYRASRGPDHPESIVSLKNLGGAYRDAKKLDKALSVLEEAYALGTARLGADHPITISCMFDLARACQAAGKLDHAIGMFEEALKLSKVKLGPEHPQTLFGANNLAIAYQSAGRLNLELFESTFSAMKRILGPEHPETVIYMYNLALAYREAGKPGQAIPIIEDVYRFRKFKWGPDHKDTIETMNVLATLYWTTRQFEKSIPLLEEELRLREKKMGRHHSDSLLTVGNLGVNYKDAGRLTEALPLLEECYRGSKQHIELCQLTSQLLDCYFLLGKPAEALALAKEVLVNVQNRLSVNKTQNASELALQLSQCGRHLLQAKMYVEAESLLRESLAIREKHQPDAWQTFNTRSLLGGALLGQKKYTDAEPLLLKGYEGLKAREKTIPPQGATRITEAIDRLIQLYTETNKPDEVKKWQAEKDKISKTPEKK